MRDNKIRLAVRIDGTNPLHHLWNNNGTWWCHFTVHRPCHTKRRVRLSLKTGDPAEACRRRDLLFSRLAATREFIYLSIQHPQQKNN